MKKSKSYQPPVQINTEANKHAGVKIMEERMDEQKETESKMIRVDAIRMAIEVMKEDEKLLTNIISEAQKIEEYISAGILPIEKK